MLTPQEVQEKKFAKAVFGGYDMGEVDEFLDQIVSDYEQLYKENAILKGKLKALAEKVEEYRSVDEQMRKTLARAKRESDEQIEDAKRQAEAMKASAEDYAQAVRTDADSYSEKLLSEARSQSEDMLSRAKLSSDEMLTTARSEAMNKLGSVRAEIEAEQQRLQDARNETKKFAAEVAEVCRHQLEALRTIVSVPAPAKMTEQPAQAAFAAAPIPERPVQPDIEDEDEPAEGERITQRHAADDPASAAQAAEVSDTDVPDRGAADKPVSSDNEPTIRFEKPRKVDVGGSTVEIGDLDDEQSDDDAFRQIFGGRGNDGE